MDINAIDLDEFDKSDISSDWDSSEDEVSAMDIEVDQDLSEKRMDELTEIAERTRSNDMSDSDGEGETIPSLSYCFYFSYRNGARSIR